MRKVRIQYKKKWEIKQGNYHIKIRKSMEEINKIIGTNGEKKRTLNKLRNHKTQV